jgi:hypothetical protein
MTWYESDPSRLVLEHLRVMRRYPRCSLNRASDSTLYWTGEATVKVGRITPDTMAFRVEYPESFPATYPDAFIVRPELPPGEVGHEWHRWPRRGNICFVKPKNWQIGTTADEIISKLEDWYFNYVAVKNGLVGVMPELGRAILPDEIGDNG